MAESSEHSVQTDRKPTTKIKSLTRGQALEILQEAVIRCQQAGIEAGVRDYYGDGKRGIEVILVDVVLANGNLMLAKED